MVIAKGLLDKVFPCVVAVTWARVILPIFMEVGDSDREQVPGCEVKVAGLENKSMVAKVGVPELFDSSTNRKFVELSPRVSRRMVCAFDL